MALRIPRRDGLRGFALHDLPRLGPFRLERAQDAFERARAGMRAALLQ
jgi:hypothetical protein